MLWVPYLKKDKPKSKIITTTTTTTTLIIAMMISSFSVNISNIIMSQSTPKVVQHLRIQCMEFRATQVKTASFQSMGIKTNLQLKIPSTLKVLMNLPVKTSKSNSSSCLSIQNWRKCLFKIHSLLTINIIVLKMLIPILLITW